ncbi:MAG: thiamine-phosphate kinase [Gemmatimonadales bacterium]
MKNLAPLAEGSEFDKIRRIWRALGDRAVAGGDDCAIVQLGSERLAVSTDMAIEGVHFQLGWIQPHEVGWRVGAAALSDLAAVAASPIGLLASLGVSAEWPDDFVAELTGGIGEVAGAVEAKVWGGDLVTSEKLVIDVVALGSVSEPIMRSGASVGDTLWVTGRLGAPLAALTAWQGRNEPDRMARERFARPMPRVKEARWLDEHGACAMIDLSDGLVADAGQLAAASGVRCVIEAGQVPVHPAADPTMALAGGEEYELLVAMPRDFGTDHAAEFSEGFDLSLERVGEVAAGSGVQLLRDGLQIEPPVGYRHF